MLKDTYTAKPNTFTYIILNDGSKLEIWTSSLGTTVTVNNHEKEYEHEYDKPEKKKPVFDEVTHKLDTCNANISKLTADNITFHYVDFINNKESK